MKFGNGADGHLNVTGTSTTNSVFGVLDSDAAASSNSVVLTSDAAGLGFAAGDCVWIHQSKHKTDPVNKCGKFEENYIVSVSGTTVNLLYPTTNAYYGDVKKTILASSHPDISTDFYIYETAAQLIKIPRYSGITIQNGGSLVSGSWTRSSGYGGILRVKVSGILEIKSGGAISMTGRGFTGGLRANRRGLPTNIYYHGFNGEHRYGGHTQATGRQDVGGGWGNATTGGGTYGLGGGGGAGNNSAGTNGEENVDSGANVVPPDGDMSSAINFPGGGGAGGTRDESGLTALGGDGGTAGGIIFIEARDFRMAGNINNKGNDGTSANSSGGGSGGGSVRIDCATFIYTSGTIGTNGGTGGIASDPGNGGKNGGNGGTSKQQINACSISGTIASSGGTKTESIGGKNWCGSVAAIIH